MTKLTVARSVAIVAVALVGCAGPVIESSPKRPAPAASVVTPAASASASPPAASVATPASAPTSAARTTVEELPVEGYLPALVGVPPDVGVPRPLVVVTHGAGGRPEPHCARYLELTRARAFVLCTRGRDMDRLLPPSERGYFYDGHRELGRELLRAMDALKARHGPRVDVAGAVFAGYSQGATMGILFLHESAEGLARFSRVLLVEGGAGDWNIALSRRMARSGVAKVALVCGQVSCHEAAEQSVRWMKNGGLDARESYAAGAGHTYEDGVRPLVSDAFAWLVEGDERF